MNYYIQGDAANADKINAAFEKLGYNSRGFDFSCGFFYTVERDVHYCVSYDCVVNIIKTHPDYKELELAVKSKFKVGDWIVRNNGSSDIPIQVYGLKKDRYLVTNMLGSKGQLMINRQDEWRLWAITDAKGGDVLTDGKKIVIFNKFEEPAYKQHIIAYVGLDLCGKLQITEDTWRLGVDKAMPATKEQHDLLFAKMKEAGYQWDSEKKELRKIKPHYDISNFNPFDKVLVRCSNDEEWMIEFYCKYDTLVHTSPHRDYPFMGIGDSYSQCIPFEGNEHLLGTTDMCDEQYINW